MSDHRNPGDLVRQAAPPEWWLQAIADRADAADPGELLRLVLLLLAVIRLLEAAKGGEANG